jgi:hypothetical protein
MPTYTQKNESTEPKKVHSSVVSDEESLVAPVVEAQVEELDAYAKELSFMAEEIEVMILPSYDQSDTTRLVDISVNGKSFYFIRGEWRKVPRYVLEILATAKHQAWNFGYKIAANGVTTQTQDSSNLLRYPHHFRDTNPKGMEWYNKIKDMVR